MMKKNRLILKNYFLIKHELNIKKMILLKSI